MKGLDLRKFKKIGDDARAAMLQHPDGHQIKIAKAALSPGMLETLNSLPIHKAAGGDVEEYADGGETYPAQEPDQKDQVDPSEPTKGVTINVNPSPQPQAPVVQSAPIQQPPPAMQPQTPVQAAPAPEAPASQQAQAPQQLNNPEQDATIVPDTSQAPQAAQPPAQPMAQEQQQTVTPAPNSYEQHKQSTASELAQEDQAWQHDLQNGHITPKTYSDLFAKKDTLGKIGTLFGMMLSGAGSGLAKQENAMLGAMNKEISNDLEAQKASKENAKNYLQLGQQALLNQAQAGSLNQETASKAFALAQTKMNVSALHFLSEQVKNMPQGSPQRAQAEQTLGMLYNAVQGENYNIIDKASSASAYYKTILGDQSGGQDGSFQKRQAMLPTLGPAGQARAKYESDRYIPGVGMAAVEVPQEKRNELEAMTVLDKKAADVLDFAKKHKGSLDPKVRAQGAQKAAEMLNFYNKSIAGGVLTEGRLKWLDEQVKKNPTSVFQDILGNNSKLREIQEANSGRRDILLKSLGVRGGGSASSSQKTKSEAKDEPSEGATGMYKGSPVVRRNGKWEYK